MDAATTLPRTMTAWRQDAYGGPDRVSSAAIAVPEPGRGEVLLRVRAVGLNAGDVRVMRGEPTLIRLAFGLRRPRRATRGMDTAGTVVALGPDVEGFAVGDEVVGELAGGGLADYAVAPAARLVRRPASVAPALAAALPIAAGTAWRALAGVSAGDRVLVLGASGGVGSFTVQLAAARGATVHATCGERNRALVERLGAAETFDYRRTDVAALEADSYDRIVDIAGTAPLRDLQRLLVGGGSIVLVSGGGTRILPLLGRMLAAAALSIGSGRRIRPLAATPDTGVLTELLTLVVDGSITPVIEREFPLSDARAALAHVDGGHTVGKVVVTAG